jgi:hypothetical protein
MSIHDDMSEDDVLRAAAACLSALPVAGPPAAEAIMARGRARRRRTVTGLGLAGTVGVTALALGLAGVLGGHSPAHAGTTIRTAAFTLTRNANGTDTLTISPLVLVEPGTLQSDLAQYGIQAMVHSGSFCSSDPAPDWSQVMSFSPRGNGPVLNPTITINPSAMPASSELSFGYFQLPVGQETALALINTKSYTCTSTAPTVPPAGGALFSGS